MSGRLAPDYGFVIPGEFGVAATGTTLPTAYLIYKQVTVFATVASGAIAILPSSFASGVALTIKNRGANALTISPGSNQIETNSPGVTASLAAGADMSFQCFNPVSSGSPRIWWEGNISANGNFLPLSGGTLTGALGAQSAVLVGTGTPYQGHPYQFQVSTNFDPSASAVSENRQFMFLTNLNYSNTTSNLCLGVSSFVTVNGPGVANGEINLFQAQLTVASNASVNQSENYESSTYNNGIMNNHDGFLCFFNNAVGATVTGSLYGATFSLINANSTSGVIPVYVGINFDSMTGGGSHPTFEYSIRNRNPQGVIASLGQVVIGSISPQATTHMLTVFGGTNSGTDPSSIFNNAAGATGLAVFNDASVFMSSGNMLVSAAGLITAPSLSQITTAGLTVAASGSKLGVFGATPIVKPTVSGAKASNAALASLMTALSALGIVTDSTTT